MPKNKRVPVNLQCNGVVVFNHLWSDLCCRLEWVNIKTHTRNYFQEKCHETVNGSGSYYLFRILLDYYYNGFIAIIKIIIIIVLIIIININIIIINGSI